MTSETEHGELRFEDGLAALEALVAQLESGELPLEEALRAYEQGVALVRTLNGRLAAAEERIQVVMRGDDGRPRLRPLDEDEA